MQPLPAGPPGRYPLAQLTRLGQLSEEDRTAPATIPCRLLILTTCTHTESLPAQETANRA